MKVYIDHQKLKQEMEKRLLSIDEVALKSRLTRRTIEYMLNNPERRFHLSSGKKVLRILKGLRPEDIFLPEVYTKESPIKGIK